MLFLHLFILFYLLLLILLWVISYYYLYWGHSSININICTNYLMDNRHSVDILIGINIIGSIINRYFIMSIFLSYGYLIINQYLFILHHSSLSIYHWYQYLFIIYLDIYSSFFIIFMLILISLSSLNKYSSYCYFFTYLYSSIFYYWYSCGLFLIIIYTEDILVSILISVLIT